MRNLIAASLILAPTFMYAQQSSVRAEAPKMMAAAAAVTPKAHVFTGIIAPKRINDLDRAAFVALTNSKPVTVNYTVDAQGVPQNIKVDGASEALASKITEAVSKLRYTPGTLNGQNFAFPVSLTLKF